MVETIAYHSTISGKRILLSTLKLKQNIYTINESSNEIPNTQPIVENSTCAIMLTFCTCQCHRKPPHDYIHHCQCFYRTTIIIEITYYQNCRFFFPPKAKTLLKLCVHTSVNNIDGFFFFSTSAI